MKPAFYKILLLIFIVFNLGLGNFGLSESSEARYAEISREMVTTGDYLRPNLLGINHYHKPPVTYYITALGYHIFGINEFGARFFLGVALLFQIYLVFRIGRILFKEERIAIAGALIYFSFPIAVIAARNLTTDAYLTTFILWSIYFWLQNRTYQTKVWLYAFYAVLGIAFLTKGPVALLPVALFVGCYLIIRKEKLNLSIHDLFGILLFILLAASWFIAIILDNPKLWDYFIHKQIVERATNADKFHRSKPFWYYLIFGPLLGLPWVFFIFSGYFKKYKEQIQENKYIKVLTLVSLILFIIFSAFSSKLILYILPIYPFLAILGGYILYKISDVKLNWFIKTYQLLLGILVVGLITINFTPSISMPYLYNLVLILVIGTTLVYSIKFSKFEKQQKLLYAGVSFILGLILTHTLFSANNPYMVNSVKDLIGFVKQEKGNDLNRLIVYDYLLPSASFYLNDDIVTVHNQSFPTEREVQFEEGETYKNNYIDLNIKEDQQHFEALMKEGNNVLIERAHTPLPDSLRYLLKQYLHKKKIDKYIVHY